MKLNPRFIYNPEYNSRQYGIDDILKHFQVTQCGWNQFADRDLLYTNWHMFTIWGRLVTHVFVKELSWYWFRLFLVTPSARSYYLNQCPPFCLLQTLVSIKIYWFSLKDMHLKISCEKYRPFCRSSRCTWIIKAPDHEPYPYWFKPHKCNHPVGFTNYDIECITMTS